MSLKRFVVTCCGAIFLGVWSSFIALSMHYAATRPNQPDPPAGRVFELNQHGSYAYLTSDEQWRLWLLQFGAWPFAIAGVLLARYWKITSGPLDDLPKNIREQLHSEPRRDYDKIRSTYKTDADPHDGA
jgi:hypothetical protein